MTALECKQINEMTAFKYLTLAKEYFDKAKQMNIPEELLGLMCNIESLYDSMEYTYKDMLDNESFYESSKGLMFIGIYYGRIRELYFRITTSFKP